MPLGMLGLKVGMTQVYDDKGEIAPVTVLQAGPLPGPAGPHTRSATATTPCSSASWTSRAARRSAPSAATSPPTSSRNAARRMQDAGVQVLPKANCEPQRYIREFRLDEPRPRLQVGTVLTVEEVFKDVPARGRDRHQQGPRLHRRHEAPRLQRPAASHGVKKGSRQRGSIGSHASNRGSGRPKKGIRMAGQYGNARVTIRNLNVVKIDAENNLLLVRGAVPGPNGGLVMVRPTNKKD